MKLPSTATLLAFESAARHNNFSRAAEELNTSQSAISRHIASLEAQMKARLFIRDRKTVRLTEQGEFLFAAVRSGLKVIRNATDTVTSWGNRQHITISCTHEISHLFIMPRFEQLQAHIGDACAVRVMTYEYDTLPQTMDPRIDIILTYNPTASDRGQTVCVMPETVRPVCSPEFRARHKLELLHAQTSMPNKPPSSPSPGLSPGATADWHRLPLLRLTKPNHGWAGWEDWFEHAGTPQESPQFTDFTNYVYLLEAAVSGRGIALGWSGLVDRHLSDGTLVPVTSGECRPLSTRNALYAEVNVRSEHANVAQACALFLALE